ncbi:MAG TPA: LysM peptidoglycan-binding domain-containing protein, partial [Firmicutes bacterium]|nr:LysM peptidoglycan-binding domain-containing protein [Bacillota bacterium]
MVNYVVQPGDTLWRIARQFGVPPEAIARENNLLDPNLVFPGQILVIPTAGVPPAPKAPGPSPPLPMPPVVPPPGLRIYVVQPGDTLAEIAARYGVSVEAIARANNIANPDLIYAGQILVIPVAAPPVPPVPPVTPPPPPITPPPIP